LSYAFRCKKRAIHETKRIALPLNPRSSSWNWSCIITSKLTAGHRFCSTFFPSCIYNVSAMLLHWCYTSIIIHTVKLMGLSLQGLYLNERKPQVNFQRTRPTTPARSSAERKACCDGSLSAGPARPNSRLPRDSHPAGHSQAAGAPHFQSRRGPCNN